MKVEKLLAEWEDETAPLLHRPNGLKQMLDASRGGVDYNIFYFFSWMSCLV